jgi:putative NADH-flavin reductase
MRILVFGAAGRTGRHVVEQALGHGHDVTAFIHATPLALQDSALATAHGDVLDFDSVRAAVTGQDAVVSTLGMGRGAAGNPLSSGIANVIHAMTLEGVSRLAAASACGTFARKDKRLTFGFRTMIATVLKATYDELEEMEMRIMASDLEWTIVRPVGLTDGPLTGVYRVSLEGDVLPDAVAVSRADVAALLLKALTGETYLRRTVTVGY